MSRRNMPEKEKELLAALEYYADEKHYEPWESFSGPRPASPAPAKPPHHPPRLSRFQGCS